MQEPGSLRHCADWNAASRFAPAWKRPDGRRLSLPGAPSGAFVEGCRCLNDAGRGDASSCHYWSCMPAFLGATTAGGPAHAVAPQKDSSLTHVPASGSSYLFERPATFACCANAAGGAPPSIMAWYGGPPGSKLKLQREGPRGSWSTVASIAIPPPPAPRPGETPNPRPPQSEPPKLPARLCYRPSPGSGIANYRLYQAAAPSSPEKANETGPFVVWVDKTSYLGARAGGKSRRRLPSDTYTPSGLYTKC